MCLRPCLLPAVKRDAWRERARYTPDPGGAPDQRHVAAPWYPASMPATRARPLTNAERQRRYRVRQAAEHRQAVAEGRTLLHLFCRELVGDRDGAAWLVANGMTYKRCRFVEEHTMIRRRYRDIRNAALAYRIAGYAPRWSTVLGPQLRKVPCVTWAIHWKTERIRARLAGNSVT